MDRMAGLSVVAVIVLAAGSVFAGEVVFFDPDHPIIKASAIDQPYLDVAIYDGDQVKTVEGEPLIFGAYVDTGASGSVLSYLTATGAYEQSSLGLTQADYLGDFTETGIGGAETGKVSRDLGLRVLNGVYGTSDSSNLSQFVNYGPQRFWVRQAAGTGEVISIGEYELADPINIVGMPAIRQRAMVMDYRPLTNVETMEHMQTHLLAPNDPGMPTSGKNTSLYVEMRDFSPSGTTVHPTYSANPVVQKISLSHEGLAGQASVSNQQWLFDTGSGSTFISFQTAQALGLIPAGVYASLDDYLPHHEGMVLPVGGIGPPKDVPMFRVDEIRVATRDGINLVWNNVDLLVLDITSPDGRPLDGVFGMNLLTPSVTINAASLDPALLDPTELFLALSDVSPRYFDQAVFDATSMGNPQLRLYSQYIPLLGDANGDNMVDSRDFAAWYNHNGKSETMVANGDFNGDGIVDMRDYAAWYNHNGMLAGESGSYPVPEPFSGVLLSAGGALTLLRRRRR